MKKSIKIIIVVIIILIVVIAYLMSSNKGITAETYEIQEEYVDLYFTEEGIVGEEEFYNVFSPNSGEIISVNVSLGDSVNAGDILGEISSTNIDFQINTATQQINGYKAQMDNVYVEDNSRKSTINNSIDDLNSQLETLNVQQSGGSISKNEQLEMQQILIDKNKADLETLNDQLEKYEILYNEGIISKSDYDAFVEQIKSQENLLEQNEKQLKLLEVEGTVGTDEYFESTKNSIDIQINNLEKELQKDYVTPTIQYYNSLISIQEEQITMLEKQKEELVITAPIDGIISDLALANSNYVTQSTPIAIIKPLTENILIESSISTRDIDSIEVGSSVNIIVDKRQGEETYKGSVYSIESEAKSSISSLGVEERNIKVLIKSNDDLNLITGFDVDIEYLLYENNNAIAVPKESIFAYEDGYAVYKIEGENLVTIPIQKGVELRSKIVIEEGLAVGDIIIFDANDDNLE